MNNDSLKLKVVIDLVKVSETGVPNLDYRKITLEDTTDYAGLGVPLSELIGYFVVKDPIGNVIHQGDFTSPDITHSSGLTFDGVLVPLDAFGNPVNGTYSFQMFIRRTVGMSVTDFNTPDFKFNFCVSGCKTATKPCVEILFDCNVATATGYDNTRYKSNADVTRVLTLVPPVGAKFIDGTDAVPFLSPNSTVYANSLWTGLWQLLLRSVVTETTVSGNFEADLLFSLEATASASAACNINVCGLYTCIDKRFRELELAASAKGGVANNIVLADGFIQLTTLLNKFQIARECGKVAQAQKYYNKIKEILGCDCGCGDGGAPEFVYPLVSPPGTNVFVQGSQYISVASATVGNNTTYTVALSSSLAALIALIKTYTAQSSDNSLNIQTTTTGTATVFNFTLNTAVVDQLLGDEVDGTCLGLPGEKLSVIVQELVDRVCAGGLPPVAEQDSLVCAFNTPGSVLVTANDFFTSNVVVTITVNPVNGTAVVEPDGKTITYTPSNNFSGNDVLTYTITDADGQTSSANVNITVNPIVGVSCAVISAGFVAGLSIQAGDLQIVLTNITNYLTNVPTSNNYVIEVRDSSNGVLHTYNVAGANNSVPQVYTSPDTPLATWDNIRIVQTLISEDNTGTTCGTVTSTNIYTVPQITSSIFAGVNVTCLGVSNADPDTTIMQQLVNKACASLNTVSTANGISGNGLPSTPVKLGGTMIEDTTINGNFSWLLTLNRLLLEGASANYRLLPNFSTRKVTNITSASNIAGEGGSRQALIQHDVFVDNVTVNQVTANGGNGSSIVNQSVLMGLGGNGGVINTAISSNGERIHKVVNSSLEAFILPLNNSINVDRFVNLELGAIFRGGQSGIAIVSEYIQLFLKTQVPFTTNDAFLPATARYAIFQEGADDDNVFYGDISYYGALVNASDERIKDVGGVFEKGLEQIKQIVVVEYQVKESFGGDGSTKIGVIAQAVEEVIPEAVCTKRNPKHDIEDFKTVSNDTLLFTAINAIKHLSAEVDALKQEIANLKNGN